MATVTWALELEFFLSFREKRRDFVPRPIIKETDLKNNTVIFIINPPLIIITAIMMSLCHCLFILIIVNNLVFSEITNERFRLLLLLFSLHESQYTFKCFSMLTKMKRQFATVNIYQWKNVLYLLPLVLQKMKPWPSKSTLVS